MGHKYCSTSNSRFHNHNQRSSNTTTPTTTIFLPILCSRPSIIKEVHTSITIRKSSSKISTDPISPKISCIGQVKRKNKVVVFPNPNTHINDNNHHKYAKLRSFFSGKGLGKGHVESQGAKGSFGFECKSVVDLDPPLPVVKRRPIEGSETTQTQSSLWNRRSGGSNLRGLQIQNVHHPRHYLQPTTV